MKHFVSLAKGFMLLSCAALPVAKYRLAEDNP